MSRRTRADIRGDERASRSSTPADQTSGWNVRRGQRPARSVNRSSAAMYSDDDGDDYGGDFDSAYTPLLGSRTGRGRRDRGRQQQQQQQQQQVAVKQKGRSGRKVSSRAQPAEPATAAAAAAPAVRQTTSRRSWFSSGSSGRTSTPRGSGTLQESANPARGSGSSRQATSYNNTRGDSGEFSDESEPLFKKRSKRHCCTSFMCAFWATIVPAIVFAGMLFFPQYFDPFIHPPYHKPPHIPIHPVGEGPFFEPYSTSKPTFEHAQQTFVPNVTMWGNIQKPYPTNSWWIGMVAPGDFISGCNPQQPAPGCKMYTSDGSILNPTPDKDMGLPTTQPNYARFVMNTYPYLIRFFDEISLSVQYALRDRPTQSCNPSRLNSYCVATSGGNDTVIYQPFSPVGNMRLSGTMKACTNGEGLTRTLARWDFLSATFQWNCKDEGYMWSPLVRGSPYITMVYDGLAPFIAAYMSPTGQPASIPLYINGDTLPSGSPYVVKNSSRLVVEYSNANPGEEVFVVYTSVPVTWSCTLNVGCTADETEVVVRVAWMTDDNAELLNKYSGAYPVGAILTVNVTSDSDAGSSSNAASAAGGATETGTGSSSRSGSGSSSGSGTGTADKAEGDGSGTDTALIGFHWQVEGQGEFTALAMPHHMATLVDPVKSGLTFDTGMAGLMIGLTGRNWVMKETLPPLSMTYDYSGITESQREAIVAQLKQEDIAPYLFESGSTYTYGKLVAKYGMLSALADDFDEPELAETIRETLRNTLEAHLSVPGSHNVTALNPLRYETKFGGICSDDGLSNPGSPWFPSGPRDFGNGIYNDHHYHYGYWLFATAAAAGGNTTWPFSVPELKDRIYDLARDITNPSPADPYFVPFRMKDWWLGHSWANGFAPATEDGTDQESTTESTNAYYGVALLGAALGDSHLEEVGRVLLATEIRATQTYYQMTPTPSFGSGAEYNSDSSGPARGSNAGTGNGESGESGESGQGGDGGKSGQVGKAVESLSENEESERGGGVVNGVGAGAIRRGGYALYDKLSGDEAHANIKAAAGVDGRGSDRSGSARGSVMIAGEDGALGSASSVHFLGDSVSRSGAGHAFDGSVWTVEQMESVSETSIYPATVMKLTVWGQLWSQLAAYRTFFCAFPVCVQAIQSIPVTPCLAMTINSEWNEVSFPLFEEGPFGPINLPPTSESPDPIFDSSSYKCFMVARQAMVDKDAAWTAALALNTLTELDEGLTLTNLLAFIATR